MYNVHSSEHDPAITLRSGLKRAGDLMANVKKPLP